MDFRSVRKKIRCLGPPLKYLCKFDIGNQMLNLTQGPGAAKRKYAPGLSRISPYEKSTKVKSDMMFELISALWSKDQKLTKDLIH